MTRRSIGADAVLIAVTLACRASTPAPAPLDTKNDMCSVCRMIVSDGRLAAQALVAGEEPRFFDDLGCLAKFLAEPRAPDAVLYVADHRTGEWVLATRALYSRLPAASSTPMGSGLIAHATAESRAQDAAAAGSVPVDPRVVLGPRSKGTGP